MTIVVPELVTTDFTSDYEKMVIDYIYLKWTETNPAKPAAMELVDATIKFHVGFFDFSKPYEITALQAASNTTEVGDNGRRYQIITTVDVGVRMKRLDKNKPDPQLGNMEREIKRIAMNYNKNPQDIIGIKNMIWAGQERIYSGVDTWAKSDWRSVIHINVYYENQNITT